MLMRRADSSSGVVSSPKVRTLVADIVVGVDGHVVGEEPVDLRERRALTAISCCSQTTGLRGEKNSKNEKLTPDSTFLNMARAFWDKL